MPPALTSRLVTHFIQVGSGSDGHERLLASADAVLRTVRQAIDAGRWDSALDLVRVAEPAFALGARWGAWASILEMGSTCARALGNQTAEGWILHQQGLRAMGLGHTEEARRCLTRALLIRSAHGSAEDAERSADVLAHLLDPERPIAHQA